jgi:hypothetical protein
MREKDGTFVHSTVATLFIFIYLTNKGATACDEVAVTFLQPRFNNAALLMARKMGDNDNLNQKNTIRITFAEAFLAPR